ncbi:hypothetical protein QYM36_015557 [Artemia franciscana]|uniref:SAM domain-containing protein n=1 Tax=Artemia franciscana TaxID=6661 RepID=A0AA88L4S2_ARTSF|nr:hypothetical protein QYM36_015557 [Artemia franciscana]
MEDWITFFREAGVPEGATANYAQIFKANRIKKELLVDLNKDYLKDMGVSVVGDIISILKHAKITYEKEVRGVIRVSEPVSTPISNVSTMTKAVTLPTRKEPIRMITVNKPNPERNVIVKPTNQQTMAKKSNPVLQSKTEAEENPVIAVEAEPTTKKKVRVIVSKMPPKPGQQQRLVTAESQELKFYSDKLPQMKETKMSLVKAAPEISQKTKKSTVFDRLGDGQVSSTTIDSDDEAGPSTKKKKTDSVFGRLGDVEQKSRIFSTTLDELPRKVSRLPNLVIEKNPSTGHSRVVSQSKMVSDQKEVSAKNRIGSMSHKLDLGSKSSSFETGQRKSVFSRLGR